MFEAASECTLREAEETVRAAGLSIDRLHDALQSGAVKAWNMGQPTSTCAKAAIAAGSPIVGEYWQNYMTGEDAIIQALDEDRL